ncbi:NADAR family protein [Streptomyces sp. NBC_00335]|uniref:NADAR family protein n=1 Tax=unclassified Streptomyces TaxID=2593676 RepID=UPI00224F7267|nr:MULTISPECIES: NADAR family protein [unclassified Streptomyces]MCX5403865.1 NADAR family protein [Streptomyces sp. NBC_00086]
MTWHGPTFRISDGETIDGAWRLVWRKHDWQDDYYPEDLFVYADGRISRGGYEATDLAGLAGLLASGKLALSRPDGREWTPPPSKWLARYPEPLTDESFLGEVADEISRLAGRPTTVDLLHEAISGYQRDTTEANRSLLRDAYLAVPAHLRVYVLGDMDRQDRPLRILVTDLGEPVDGDGPAATPEMHRDALDYFADGDERAEREQAVRHADAPVGDPQPPVVLHETVYPRGWPAELGAFALRNDYDAPFTYEGETYPTVVHGYWALFAADRADHDRIRAAANAREARELGGAAAGRTDWAARRVAVMAALLRAKFGQHPRLAELLVATGEGSIRYTGFSDAPFWRDEGPRGGRNWTGRLLELIRSELAAAGAAAAEDRTD